MSVFQQVKLFWEDKEYIVEPNKVLSLIAVIEDHVTIEQLCPGPKGYKRAAIASAYAAALAHVGCVTATPEKVYDALFADITLKRLGDTINALLILMIPPEKLRAQMASLEKENLKKQKKSILGRKS